MTLQGRFETEWVMVGFSSGNGIWYLVVVVVVGSGWNWNRNRKVTGILLFYYYFFSSQALQCLIGLCPKSATIQNHR